MQKPMLAMAIGMAVVAWWPRLPPLWLLMISLTAAVALVFCRRLPQRLIIAGLLAGLVWGCLFGHWLGQGLLPRSLEQRPLWLEGQVAGLVEEGERFGRPFRRFEMTVDHCETVAGEPCARRLRRVQLNLYQDLAPASGESWRLKVKLRRPHGFANPGGFDYGSWQVAQRLGAVGNVQRSADNRRLAAAGRGPSSWRARAYTWLDQRLQGFDQRPLLLALLIGDDHSVNRDQWETMRATGTVHLFVVSGLHIALTGGALLVIGRQSWRLPWVRSRRRGQWFAVALALPVAVLYALIAGFNLPIQRALIMFAVAALSWAAGRVARPSAALCLALWLVLLADPLAVLSAGFWFSFAVVAGLLLSASGQGGEARRGLWWRSQWSATAASLPLLLAISGAFPLASVPGNLVAIPATTLVTLPLAVGGLLFDPLWPALGELCWQGADRSLGLLWWLLRWLEQLGAAWQWRPAGVGLWGLICAAAASLLCLLPRGLPGRALAPLLLLPLLLPTSQRPAAGEWRVTAVDVGQGLSVLVETEAHTLLYDTGPLFPSGTTAAELALLPLLQRRGIDTLDALVVSHADSDHAGGVGLLRQRLTVHRLLAGEPLGGEGEEPCRRGEKWRWDGIDFELLHPDAEASGNDASCVLRVAGEGFSLLLTGDIERRSEYALLDAGLLAPVDLLVAPHHGSRSSSSALFALATQPRQVLFSAGYRNPFNHPHPSIVRRYRKGGAELFNTADSGAVTWRLDSRGVREVTQQRQQWPRYWERF